MLAQTRVEGESAFLKKLDADTVVRELFQYDLVKNAAEKVGGLAIFAGVDHDHPYLREEIIEV